MICMVKNKNLIISCLLTTCLILTPFTNIAFANQGNKVSGQIQDAENYLNQFKGLDMKDLLANSHSSDMENLLGQYKSIKGDLNTKYTDTKTDVNAKIEGSDDWFTNSKSDLSGIYNGDNSSMVSKFDNKVKELESYVQEQAKLEEDMYKNKDDNFNEKFDVDKESNKKEANQDYSGLKGKADKAAGTMKDAKAVAEKKYGSKAIQTIEESKKKADESINADTQQILNKASEKQGIKKPASMDAVMAEINDKVYSMSSSFDPSVLNQNNDAIKKSDGYQKNFKDNYFSNGGDSGLPNATNLP